jgi:hypothetical protein
MSRKTKTQRERRAGSQTGQRTVFSPTGLCLEPAEPEQKQDEEHGLVFWTPTPVMAVGRLEVSWGREVTSAAAAHLQEAGAAREVGVRTRCARRSLIGPYLRQKKKKKEGREEGGRITP